MAPSLPEAARQEAGHREEGRTASFQGGAVAVVWQNDRRIQLDELAQEIYKRASYGKTQFPVCRRSLKSRLTFRVQHHSETTVSTKASARIAFAQNLPPGRSMVRDHNE